jgi:signal transduction histidine kinase
MGIREWSERLWRVLALFLAMTLAPGAALAWLGWRLLEQDRALVNQRVQERLEYVADRTASVLERYLEDLPLWLDSSDLPEQLVGLAGTRDEVAADPHGPLLYYPVLPAERGSPVRVFATAERLEFRENDPSGAAAVYRKLAASAEPSVRAGALVRLARVLRKLGRGHEALSTYEQLGELREAQVAGMPAAVVARTGRCSVWEELGERAELRREARELQSGLAAGRWPLLRAAFHYHAAEAGRWAEVESALDPDALALSEAAAWVWNEWAAEPESTGSRFLTMKARPVAVAWQGVGDSFRAVLGGTRHIESALAAAPDLDGAEIALSAPDGGVVLGRLPGGAGPRVVRTSALSRLPWTIHVAPENLEADLASLRTRRQMLFTGFGLVIVLLGVGCYFVFRAVSREIAVARMQSDFVAAVSHEFRSPLASLRQLSELLSRGRVRTDEKRAQAYHVLERESERLHRLVEDLLDFGRMESGAAPYQFAVLGAEELIRGVISEFSEEVESQGYDVELAATLNGLAIRADHEALPRALWNLLDNAVKYSPHCKTVWVTASEEDGQLAIRVRDQGTGISAGEQRQVFRKFVRGAACKAAAVRGTGLGLAMVDHIVKAHGGEVHLESEPGKGSTFTVLLPVEEIA